MKFGVVDVGGGLRGIYAVGVMDYCIDQNIHFDLGIGVSAGSANLVFYLAGQFMIKGMQMVRKSQHTLKKIRNDNIHESSTDYTL